MHYDIITKKYSFGEQLDFLQLKKIYIYFVKRIDYNILAYNITF